MSPTSKVIRAIAIRCGLWLEHLWQDIAHGARMFGRSPGFTFAAVLSIALGTGANCAMFSAVDALLLRPLPVRNPEEVVTAGARVEGTPQLRLAYPEYVDLRDRSQSFQGLAAYVYLNAAFVDHPDARQEAPRLRLGLSVTGNFFEVMGVQAALGRVFDPREDAVPSRDAVVVLDHQVWQRDFGADPSIPGRSVRINGIDFTVIGVLPESFPGPNQFARIQFYIPTMMWPSMTSASGPSPLEDRSLRWMTAKGRLKPGVTIGAANAEAAIIAADLEQSYPRTNRNVPMVVENEFQARVAETPPAAVFSAMAAVLAVAVLLVACANLSGLLLSRAPLRAREIAMRMSLGAPGLRLVRQLVTENLLLAVAGGLLGLVAGGQVIGRLQDIQISSAFPIQIDFRFDGRVLGYSFAVAVATVLVFGFIPALQTARADLTALIKNPGEAALGRGRRWGRNALVSVQVAGALVLLAVAGSTFQALRRAQASGPGFRTSHLLLMTLNPALAGYTPEQTFLFLDRVKAVVSETPGVKSVAQANIVPLSLAQLDAAGIVPEGYRPQEGGENAQTVHTHMAARVDENYFDTMSISLLAGRSFRRSDDAGAPLVAIVNQALAERYWPGENAVGKRFRRDAPDGPWVEVVGVAETTKYLMTLEAPTPYLYFPQRQNPAPGQTTLLVESFGDSAELAGPLRRAIGRLDRNQPLYDVRTMEQFYRTRAANFGTLQVQIVAGMGLTGLLLSMIGLYGLVAYSVNRRTREIGIRMAVGASPGSVLWGVLRRGLGLASAGVGLGLMASRAMDAMMVATFEGVERTEPTVYLRVVPVLIVTALLAAYLPARRASRIDPTLALRNE